MSAAFPEEPVVTVQVRDPQELIAVVPYLLGYQPRDSVVALIFHHQRVELAVSIDLLQLEIGLSLWDQIAASMNNVEPDAVAIIAYAPESAAPLILDVAAASPVRMLDVLRVDDERWWCLNCTDPSCHSPSGSPLRAQPHIVTPLIAEAGLSPARSRADLAACLTPAPTALLEAVAECLGRETSKPVSPSGAYAELVAAHRARRDGPIALDPAQAARLLQGLSHRLVRDACASWYDDAGWWLWNDLIPLAPSTHVPLVATLLALSAYQRGATALTDIALQHALAVDPTYELAGLIAYCLGAQVAPSVVITFTRRGAALALDHLKAAASSHLSGQAGS